ncbi:hypothetical protein K443DRAFT_523325 [Laccaria amethystina LaAM-08-1]|jgi:hypothetical protein|uniref:Uncharacterized protein n=1 Tax=Laccaria amethystina LaAM-08-1 TaxID=1095629 RepID=A0A0C9XBP6_9AGAR|nr:hypothetical protein K443DRAFT_523325 [Laccaria amethystina LaAM-08-1]
MSANGIPTPLSTLSPSPLPPLVIMHDKQHQVGMSLSIMVHLSLRLCLPPLTTSPTYSPSPSPFSRASLPPSSHALVTRSGVPESKPDSGTLALIWKRWRSRTTVRRHTALFHLPYEYDDGYTSWCFLRNFNKSLYLWIVPLGCLDLNRLIFLCSLVFTRDSEYTCLLYIINDSSRA